MSNNEELEEGEVTSEFPRVDIEKDEKPLKAKKKDKKKSKNVNIKSEESDLKTSDDEIEKIEKKVKIEGKHPAKKRKNEFVSSTFKVKPCEFYRKGACQKGEDCTYSHDFPVEKLEEICKFYLTGNCHKGESCPFSHDLKRYPCKFYWGEGNCNAGPHCRFSHEMMTDRKRIWDFMEENEGYLMNVYQAHGRTGLGNYFLEYLQKKKAERDSKTQHLLLPATQEPTHNPTPQGPSPYQMQPSPMNLPQQNINPPPHGFPVPQDKQIFQGKQQYFDPNLQKQQYMQPPPPGQGFQGKQFPQMPGQLPQGPYGQPMQPVQNYPQNPQFNQQMPMGQINPNYPYQPPPQSHHFHQGQQYHHPGPYQPQYHQQQHQLHQQRPPHLQNPPHHPHQMYHPQYPGQMPSQMHPPNFQQMGQKQEDKNIQQQQQQQQPPYLQQSQPNRPMQYNLQQAMNPPYQDQTPVQQLPQNKYNYPPKVDHPISKDVKGQPVEHSALPFNIPQGISQQTTNANSLAQSTTSTPAHLHPKEMVIEEQKINRLPVESPTVANKSIANKETKSESLQNQAPDKTEKVPQTISQEFKPPSSLIGNKIVSQPSSQHKMEVLTPEKDKKEIKPIDIRKFEAKRAPPVGKRVKETPKNLYEAQVFNQANLLEKFGIFKERRPKKIELSNDMDKLFSIFEFHSEKSFTPQKIIKDVGATSLKETLKNLNDLLSSVE